MAARSAGFLGRSRRRIDWFEKPKTVFDPKAGVYGRWFPDGVCNTCFNAVDRQVDAGRGEQAAFIYDSPLAGAKRTITYHRLLTETQVLGGMLRDFGVDKGDRVMLYMPMVPEAVIAMLACARIGAMHSVVFGGFAAARTRNPHRRCQAESDSVGKLRPRAGPHRATTSRCSTRRSSSPSTSRRPVSSCSARSRGER